MDVSGIGVQTISTTTGTTAQNVNPAPVQIDNIDTSAQRVNPPPATGTGNVVDKVV